MDRFNLTFEVKSFFELDEKIALLACQDYNFGNKDDWFGAFRGGLFGFYSRIYGVTKHYNTVHAWIPIPRNNVEYELSSIMFHMDSAVECLIYAINALGNSVEKDLFIDISVEKNLRKISPLNILGNKKKGEPPLKGYGKYFPSVQECWINNQELISKITELHDVSKHRETIYVGGQCRLDEPKGFYEMLGITNEQDKYPFWPMAEIILMENPKTNRIDRVNGKEGSTKHLLLEDVSADFSNFIKQIGELLLNDARNNIKLKYNSFQ